MIIWMAFAIDVRTRLWMAGAVSTVRDRKLIDHLFQHVRACCQLVQGGILVCTDGFAAYRKSIIRAFRLISQEDSRAWKMLFRGLERPVHCNSNQTNGEDACGRSGEETYQRNRGESTRVTCTGQRM
jgi:hypothetical protein